MCTQEVSREERGEKRKTRRRQDAHHVKGKGKECVRDKMRGERGARTLQREVVCTRPKERGRKKKRKTHKTRYEGSHKTDSTTKRQGKQCEKDGKDRRQRKKEEEEEEAEAAREEYELKK